LLLSSVAEARLPSAVLGKAFFTVERIKDADTDALAKLFVKAKPRIELERGKDKRWKATLVAFFRKAPADGPMTLWLYDKEDKASLKAKEPVHVFSIDNVKPKQVFIYDLDIDPDRGFNKNHTYLVFIGQIFGKRHQHYAKGEVALK